MGKVDLLTVGANTVDIVDYKTGEPDPGHEEQLRIYALLWARDDVVNPDHLPVASLRAVYRSGSTSIAAPSPAEGDALAAAIEARIAAADSAVASDNLVAILGDHCRWCPVKGLCGDYWAAAPTPRGLADGAWFDYEGVVGPAHGVRSRWMLDSPSGTRELLLRTSASSPPLELGTRVRIVGLRREIDSEIDASVIAQLPATAEVFLLDGH